MSAAVAKKEEETPSVKKSKEEISDETVKLYIGGIDPSWSNEKIIEILSPHGKVTRADVVKNFAFAFVEDQKAADNIIKEVSGKTFDSQKLVVQISKNKQNLIECDDLCFECGESGHWARECAVRTNRVNARNGRSQGPSGFNRDNNYAHQRGNDYSRYPPRDRDPYPRDYPSRPYERDMYREPYRDPYPSSRLSYDRCEPSRSYVPLSYRDRSPPPPSYSYRRSPPPPSRSAYGREADPYAANRERLAYGRGSYPDTSTPRSADPYDTRRVDSYSTVSRSADSYSAPRSIDPYTSPHSADPYSTSRSADPYITLRSADPYSASRSADPYSSVRSSDPYGSASRRADLYDTPSAARSSYSSYGSADPAARSSYASYDTAGSASRSYASYDTADSRSNYSAYDSAPIRSSYSTIDTAAKDPYAATGHDRYVSDASKRYSDPAYQTAQRTEY